MSYLPPPACGSRSRRLTLTVALAAAMWLPWSESTVDGQARSDEVRALWVQRTSLVSPETIREMVETAAAGGFNTLLVQVRGRGDAYYRGTLEPRGALLAAQPSGFDPLQEVLAVARAEGLTVHAWVNANLVASSARLPAERSHIVYRHPEWMMVPRELAGEMAAVDPQSPAYIGTLARWTRGRSNAVEGLYLSPVHTGAADHLAAVARELAESYALDGLHLDYLRYPSAAFDYSPATLAAFRASVQQDLLIDERRRLDTTGDPAIYTTVFPERWLAFRRARLTSMLTKVRTAVKGARPGMLLSAAVVPDSTSAANDRLQDWRSWLESGLLDAVCPMAYTPDAAQFARQIRAARELAGTAQLWAGIGAYRLPPGQTVENIRTARQLGANGVVLFSYDSFVAPSLQHPPDYLKQVGREAFRPATLVGAR